MNDSTRKTKTLVQYHAWDRMVRLFHWTNVLCVIGLIGVGLVILNGKTLGVTSDGKILLKTIHVYIGYVFAVNLGWRIIWGFLGNRYARWAAILPFGDAYKKSLSQFVEEAKKGKPPHYLGHNPIARLMVALLFLLLSLQAVTGLVLAGTDIYFPPFGQTITEWIAEDPTKVAEIKPYSKVNVNPDSYETMRSVRKPFITIHVYVFYALLGAILLHLIGVVVSELREKSGLVSAMFTGKKVFHEKPIDLDEQ